MISKDFLQMDRAVIDACSIIYLIKTGVLGNLGAALALMTTPEVFAETGWKELPVQIVPSLPGHMTHDAGLVFLAVNKGLSVISDDKEVLEAASSAHLDYYNSLMMLIWLEGRGRITGSERGEYWSRLRDISHYSDAVWEKGEEIRLYVLDMNKEK